LEIGANPVGHDIKAQFGKQQVSELHDPDGQEMELGLVLGVEPGQQPVS